MTAARREPTMRGMTGPAAPNLAPPNVGRLRIVLAEAARWYRERLLTDRPPLAVATLTDRGLVDLAAVTPAGRRWQLGYAPAGRPPSCSTCAGRGSPTASCSTPASPYPAGTRG